MFSTRDLTKLMYLKLWIPSLKCIPTPPAAAVQSLRSWMPTWLNFSGSYFLLIKSSDQRYNYMEIFNVLYLIKIIIIIILIIMYATQCIKSAVLYQSTIFLIFCYFVLFYNQRLVLLYTSRSLLQYLHFTVFTNRDYYLIKVLFYLSPAKEILTHLRYRVV